MNWLLSILPSAVRLTLPMLFGALGVVVCAKAGVIFMAMEGGLLGSAFVATYITYITGYPIIGMGGAVVFGVIYSLLLGFFIVKCAGNHVVCSIGFNFMMLGATTILMQPVFGNTGFSPGVNKLPLFNLPVLGEQSISLPIIVVAILLVCMGILRTNWGLRLCAIGENPATADTLGININRYRFQAFLICGVLTGLGGAELTLGQVGFFSRNITASMGYLSYSAVVFGGYHPVMTVLTTFILGFFDAFQMRAQLTVSIPGEFLLSLPYAVTIIALSVFGRRNGPAMLGKNYGRE